MGAFGGGIASSGNVCGILSGGVALISSIYSRGNLGEKEDPKTWRLSYKLFKIFENLTESFGSINCRDIARVNWGDKEATRNFYKNPESSHKICTQLVGDFAFALGELLDKDAETQPLKSK
jgi:C_GCAxxG_C_C family probable redox protein